ncbi:MAG: M48 family metallopeptidase [Burkholderiales bacterium]
MSSLFVTTVFAALLLAVLLTRFWLIGRQVRHVAAHRASVPPRFAERVTLAAHQRAADYTIARHRLDLLAIAWGAAVLLGWTLLGGLDQLNQQLLALLQPRWGDLGYQLGLLTAVSLIGALLDLPLEAWRTFRLEQHHGFNRMTPAMWLRDLLLAGLVGALIGLPLAALVLWLMAATGSTWWLWAFGVFAGFMLLMQLVYPTVIAPLFNKFEPLGDEALRRRVEALMQRCGFRASGLFVMDGSKRSAHANAYFTGFGAAKRVVFFDTLLGKLAAPEVEAVLAHELGHAKLGHVPKRIGAVLLLWGASLALINWLMAQPAFFTGLGVTPLLDAPNHALALILVMLVAPVVGFFASPLAAALSRRHEFEADAYACAHSRADDLASALLKLYEDNASTLTPDPVYVRFHYSHPPASERLAALPLLTAPTPVAAHGA